MKIWFRLHGFEPCSWTYVWENLRQAFIDIGVEIYDLTNPPDPENCVELWWGDPQFWRWSSMPVKARVSLALSEAHSILARGRDEVIANLRASDLIICPSQAATTAFMEAPIDVPIKVVHFGIDPKQYYAIERDWISGSINFLHAGVTQFRKGSWLVPEAFVSTFKNNETVSLTIASPRSSPMFTRLKSEYGKAKNINFTSDLKESPMELYRTHHVFVSPHLSEGFGLMIPEAMATGMPCLVSRCSAPREYFSSEFGWWIEMSEGYAGVDQCLPDTSGFWRVPSIESICEGMITCYEERSEAISRGKKGAEFCKTNLRWGLTAKRIVELIKKEVLGEKNLSVNDGI